MMQLMCIQGWLGFAMKKVFLSGQWKKLIKTQKISTKIVCVSFINYGIVCFI